MPTSKKALGWTKPILTTLFVFTVMAGSLYLAPRDQWMELARYVPVLSKAVSPAPQPSQPMASGEGKAPTHAPVRLNVTKQQLIGVTTGEVNYLPVTKTIRTMGKVTYDETRLVDINLRMDGWIEKLFVNYTGQLVEQGQRLLTLYSPTLVTAEKEYLLALRPRSRLSDLAGPNTDQRADSLVESSRQRLLLLNITDAQIRDLARKGKSENYRDIWSPASGFVIEKNAIEKMHVKAGETLFRIADLSTIWINADIYEQALSSVEVGQTATITLPYDAGKTLEGRVRFIYPFLDPRTRTATVQFSFPNPGFALKPEMFVNVAIKTEAGTQLAVPESAVLPSGLRQLVFVDKGQGIFEPREVKLGAKFDGHHVVLEGLSAGEKVVTSANFLLDSESRLKAATGGMTGMMSLIGMGDAPMPMVGDMEGMGDMGGMAGMSGMGGMEGMEAVEGMKGMKGMEAVEGMELAK